MEPVSPSPGFYSSLLVSKVIGEFKPIDNGHALINVLVSKQGHWYHPCTC